MKSRVILYLGLAVGALALLGFGWDLAFTSDEERLEALAEGLTEGPSDDRLDAVLEYTDPNDAPLSINRRRFYDDGDLSDRLRRALAPLIEEGELEVLQRSIDVEESRATVALRVRSEEGLHNATFTLARTSGRWLITQIRVS